MLWLGLCDSVTIRFYIYSNFKLQQMCFDCISSPTSNAWISKYSVHVSYNNSSTVNIHSNWMEGKFIEIHLNVVTAILSYFPMIGLDHLLKRYFYNIYVVKHIYCTITFPDKIKFYHDEKYCVVIVLHDKIILSFKIVFRSQFFFVE